MDTLARQPEGHRPLTSLTGVVDVSRTATLTPPTPIPAGLRTKVVRPRLPSDHVIRPRLLGLLDRTLERRLALVVAPGGFGKTTLLASWQPAGHMLAWVSLDEGDGDVRAFLRTLVAAVQTTAPSFGSGVLGLLNLAKLPPTISLAGQLSDALAELPDDIVVIFDDYHLVKNPEVDDLLRKLLARLDENTHIVVSSRDEPALPTARLRALGDLVEVRVEQLTFTDAEAQEFLAFASPGAQGVPGVERLIERSEGWPAGLRLAVLAMSDEPGGTGLSPGFLGRGAQYAREFLIDDVLATLPVELREVLMRAAILDRFCAPLLDALFAETDTSSRGAEWLATLKRRNLFITMEGAEGDWCRFHDLFRDALRHQFTATCAPAILAQLHQRASDWFTQQGLISEAMKHALAAGNTSHAVTLLEANINPVIDREEDPSRIEEWLRILPPEVLDRESGALLARGWLLGFRNRIGELPPLVRAVEMLLDADTTRDTASREALRGVIDVFRAYLQAGAILDIDGVLEATESALARLPRTWRGARGHAEFVRAASLAKAGRNTEALAWIEACRADLTHADGSRLGLILRGEGHAHFWTLRTADLARTAREMIALGREQGLRFTATWGSFLAGIVSYHWNDLEEARNQFQAAVENRSHVGIAIALDCDLGLALTLQALGDEDGAASTLANLAALLVEIGNQGAANLLHSCQARLALARDDIDEAGRRMRLVRGDELSTFPSFVEVPAITRARWLLLQGTRSSLDEATTLIDRLRDASRGGHLLGRIRVRALEALVLQTRGDTEGALAVLEDVMAVASAAGLLRFFVDFGPPMQRLLVELERRTSPTNPHLSQILAAFPALTGPVGTAVPSRHGADAGSVDALTWREIEVLKLLDARLSNKEIARTLHISSETVKKHTGNIYQKLQVGSRREAVSRAHGLGLLRIVPRTASE